MKESATNAALVPLLGTYGAHPARRGCSWDIRLLLHAL